MASTCEMASIGASAGHCDCSSEGGAETAAAPASLRACSCAPRGAMPPRPTVSVTRSCTLRAAVPPRSTAVPTNESPRAFPRMKRASRSSRTWR
eukprot:71729-Prymnesium_polylepis.1